MAHSQSTNIATFSHHARADRRVHILFGSVLVIATLAVVAMTSVGAQLFQSSRSDSNKDNEAISFAHINTDAPLPLLMDQGQKTSAPVYVKGEEITKDSTSTALFVTPSTTLTDQFVRSFAFATAPSDAGLSISVSWNTQITTGSYLYVVHESRNEAYKNTDKELYSIEGSGMGISSHIFDVKNLKGYLYLSVYHLHNGTYELVDNSSIVSDSNR